MKERTFVMIKPDAMKKNLAGEILRRFQEAGLKVVAIKLMMPDKELVEDHYPKSEKQLMSMGGNTLRTVTETGNKSSLIEIYGSEEPMEIGLLLREWLIKYITSHPVIAMVLEGEDVIKTVRKIVGFTDPSRADKGTIRGDLGTDSTIKANSEGRAIENLVHASGSPEEAEREINLWFRKEEIVG